MTRKSLAANCIPEKAAGRSETSAFMGNWHVARVWLRRELEQKEKQNEMLSQINMNKTTRT